jgi:hypothetical protein
MFLLNINKIVFYIQTNLAGRGGGGVFPQLSFALLSLSTAVENMTNGIKPFSPCLDNYFLSPVPLPLIKTKPEPEFVNLLRSPGIDSRPGWPIRQPHLTYRPARLHIGWRNRFLHGLLKRLQIRALLLWSRLLHL